MDPDPQIQALLEEVLVSGRDLEEVCRANPSLAPRIRDALKWVESIDAEFDAMFPTPERSPTKPSADLPRIDGYDIEAILGHGGMGVVYRARHRTLERPVALKMLLAGSHAEPSELERFRREAVAVAQLRHPNIVAVYDVGEFEGQPFFTMELLDGGSLASKLGGAPLPAREAANLVATLAYAVSAAHGSGIVHRDLKPSNVLLTADGTPKITDFGLARRIDGESDLTRTGARLGTPSYMAPEQALGTRDAIGPAVDVYALGAVLYEVLTGRPPFRAESAAATERQVIAEDPAPPSRQNASVPRDLETICLKCLRKQPKNRYATAAELGDDLRRFERGEPIAARRVGRIERSMRWVRRNPTGAMLVAAMLALTGLGIGTGLREWALFTREREEIAKWAERLDFVEQLEEQGRFAEARTILGRVPDAGSETLRQQIRTAQEGLTLLERLDEIRLGRMVATGNDLGRVQSDREYFEAFLEAGLITANDSPEQVAARLRASPLRRALLAAIDDWAYCARENPARRDELMTIARRVDSDPWRDRVRDRGIWKDRTALEELAQRADVANQPAALLLLLANLLGSAGGDRRTFLRKVLSAHPDDFWANFLLAQELGIAEEAIGYLRAARALRPNSFAVDFNLGVVLIQCGFEDEAIECWRRALLIDPASTTTRVSLGMAYMSRGELDLAIEEGREAIRAAPRAGDAYAFLGLTLFEVGAFDESAEMTRRALELLDEDDYMRNAAVDMQQRLARVPGFAARLPFVLRGMDRPETAEEYIEIAQHALRTKQHAAAARCFDSIFGRWPELASDLTNMLRFNAACAAARAENEGEPWRERAIAWLRADLDEWRAVLEQGSDEARRRMRVVLTHWKRDPDLASVRDELDRLAAPESAACKALWHEVDVLLARAFVVK